jgi:hypothetical protein
MLVGRDVEEEASCSQRQTMQVEEAKKIVTYQLKASEALQPDQLPTMGRCLEFI